MHLVIPFAAPLSEAGRAALAGVDGPRLAELLARCGPPQRDEGDEWSLSPPHERALARALGWQGWQGWQGGDGTLPWAARQARADGIEPGARAWGLLSPVHWHVGTDQVSLLPPSALMLSEAESQQLFEAVQPLFTSEGFELAWGGALRWYAAHEGLAGLRTASLDRVIGRNVDRWLGSDVASRPLGLVRRLQSEVQMLLHEHPVNEARQARGLLAVNSFWLSGCGVAQAEPSATAVAATLQVDERLREPALADDWAAWAQAWETLDAGPVADLLAAARAGQAAELTLCGERAAAHFVAAAPSALQALRSMFVRPAWRALLESL